MKLTLSQLQVQRKTSDSSTHNTTSLTWLTLHAVVAALVTVDAAVIEVSIDFTAGRI
jgi:hypothetical protein